MIKENKKFINTIWGLWEVLEEGKNFKVKRLEVLPHKNLSYQRHFKRAEHWVIVEGTAEITTEFGDSNQRIILQENESIYIPKKTWHQLKNYTNKILKVIEVSTGSYLKEDDIERK